MKKEPSFRELRSIENRIKYKHLIELHPVSYMDWRIDKNSIIRVKRNKKREYFKQVRQLTKQVNKAEIKGFDAGLVYNPRKHGSIINAFDSLVIDHKIPLIYGYKNNISPEKIAHISNLQYLTVRDNMVKGSRPLIDVDNQWIIE